MKSLISALVLLAITSAVFAETRPPTTAPTRELPALNLNGVALKDAIDFLADVSGANITVNWKALEKANVRPDTPITARAGGITFRKALSMILQQAGGDSPLTYVVEDGVLEITTQAASDEKLITRVYGIQDLLFEAQDFTGAPQLSLQNTASSGGGRSGGRSGGGGGSSNGIFGSGNSGTNTDQADKGLSQKERADEIIKMITTSIRPEIWQENGGTSKISFYRGNLIVTAPQSVHRLIGG